MARREKLPKNVSAFVDRHGKRRYRFRQSGKPTRYFNAHPSSPEGREELEQFRTGAPVKGSRYAHGTVAWLASRFLASPAFSAGKGADRQREARRILESFAVAVGKDRVADFRFDHIEAILAKTAKPTVDAKGRKRGGPHAALKLRGELNPLFTYAVKLGLVQTNPVALATAPSAPKGGFHSWTEDEIAQYRAYWPLGTKARLALEIFLWTAQRRGDGTTFGRKHLKAGKITFTAAKTGAVVEMPAAPQLLEAIEAMPVTGTETFLVSRYGRPYSKGGFGKKMREWCDDAGLPHCTAHGLRKAAARRAAEAGATNQSLKALGGWTTDTQVGVYTAAADRHRLAGQALAPVIEFDLANRSDGLAKK